MNFHGLGCQSQQIQNQSGKDAKISKLFQWVFDTERADTSHIYYNSVASIIAEAHFSINTKYCEQDSVGVILKEEDNCPFGYQIYNILLT